MKSKNHGETINVTTRVTQDMQRYKEIDDQLREVYSKDFMDKYMVYCFNYSCLEADHLGIPVNSQSLEDMACFNKLRRFRTEILMDELLAFTMFGADSENVSEKEFASACEPHYIFPDDEQISIQVKERYKGKNAKNYKNFRDC